MTTTPTLWGGPTTISSDTTAMLSSLAALAEGGYVIVHDVAIAAQWDLVGRRYTDLGSVSGTDSLPLVLQEPSLHTPQVAQLADGRIATGYRHTFSATDHDPYLAYNAAATLTYVSTIALDQSGLDDFLILATEATPDGGSASLWLRDSAGPDSFVLSLSPGDGSAPVSITLDTGIDADLAVLADGRLVVAQSNIFRLLEPDGSAVSGPVSFAATSATEPAVTALANGDFVVAWYDAPAGRLDHQIFDRDGIAQDAAQSFAAYAQQAVITGLADGGYLVGWSVQSPLNGITEAAVAVQRFNASGSAVGLRLLIEAPGDQTIDDMQTLGDGRVVVSYHSATGPLASTTTLKTVILDPREASLFGTDGADSIVARLDDTSIAGGAGKDRITGMAGDDVLAGQAGDDTMNGGIGDDTLDGGSGSDNLTGAEGDDILKGGSGVDGLNGGSGSDTLYGGSSSDVLTGGSGRDFLWGGTGNDVFKFVVASESGITAATQDIIRDFYQTEDKIDLSGIDADSATASNDAFTFIGAAAFSAAGQVRATGAGNFTRIEMNTTGASGAESAILVDGIIAFAASDFVL